MTLQKKRKKSRFSGFWKKRILELCWQRHWTVCSGIWHEANRNLGDAPSTIRDRW